MKYWPLLTVGLWVLFTALINTGQYGDNIEQFNWSHSMEWGYYKHPPLPTWLLGLLSQLGGQSPYGTYLLGLLCLAACGVVTHAIALRLFGLPIANLAIVLWSLQLAFGWRAQLYNHNTLLVLMIAITVWCTLVALKKEQHRWWIAAGLAAGLSLLAKYQAVVPLTGILLALTMQGRLKEASVQRGMLLAALVALLMFMPHLLWLISHDFVTLNYVSSHDQRLDLFNRQMGLFGFFINQLRFMSPALICIVALSLMRPRLKPDDSPSTNHDVSTAKAWLFGLIGFPVIVLLLMSVGRGVALQNHWGMQSLQFVSLWLAARLYTNLRPTARSLLILAGVLHLICMGIYSNAPFAVKRHFFDLYYPVKELVQRVDRDWQSHTACPLNIVSGNAYAAGLYSAYARQHPAVMEDGSAVKSPWIDPRVMRTQGAMHFALKKDALPSDVQFVNSMNVYMDAQDAKAEIVTFYWGLQLPQKNCTLPAAQR